MTESRPAVSTGCPVTAGLHELPPDVAYGNRTPTSETGRGDGFRLPSCRTYLSGMTGGTPRPDGALPIWPECRGGREGRFSDRFSLSLFSSLSFRI